MIQYLANLQSETLAKETSFNSNYYKEGKYGTLVTPVSVFDKNTTYMVGVRDTETFNSPVIFSFKDNVLNYAEVGVIDHFDDLEHSRPAILIFNNYIYIFQVNGHGREIKIWKSNLEDDISGGFTLFHTIAGNYGYLSVRHLDNGRFCILSRVTGILPSNDSLFCQVIMLSGVNDLQTWSEIQTTTPLYNSTNNRHYPSLPFQYGVNNWQYFGISLRNEDLGGGGYYFAQAYYKTQDFQTFYSLDETYSKDVITNGVFTPTEIQDNLTVVGNLSNVLDYVLVNQFVVVEDVIYGSYFDQNTGYYRFIKIDTNGVETTYDCKIPDIPTTHSFSSRLYTTYNGTNLIIQSYDPDVDDYTAIFTCDLNFNNQILVEKLKYVNEPNPVRSVSIPYNLDEVSGEYILGGGNTPGYFTYFITDDIFI